MLIGKEVRLSAWNQVFGFRRYWDLLNISISILVLLSGLILSLTLGDSIHYHEVKGWIEKLGLLRNGNGNWSECLRDAYSLDQTRVLPDLNETLGSSFANPREDISLS